MAEKTNKNNHKKATKQIKKTKNPQDKIENKKLKLNIKKKDLVFKLESQEDEIVELNKKIKSLE